MAKLDSKASLIHTLALIAPKSRPLYVQVEFEVFGSIHGKCHKIDLFLIILGH